MSVTLAKNAGYCFGVDRAVRMVESAAERGPVATLGSVIHNRYVVEQLARHRCTFQIRYITPPWEDS